jgi:hypothetical protein
MADSEPPAVNTATTDTEPKATKGSDTGAFRARVLSQLLHAEGDLDEAFDRIVRRRIDSPLEQKTMKAVVPGDALTSGDHSLLVLLTSVLTEYEEIEKLIEGFREIEAEVVAGEPLEDAIAFVSEEELADPEALSRALAPLQSESARFEFLFEMAKSALDRLDIYRLSEKSSFDLVAAMRQEQNLLTVQSLVGFLRSLHSAADSFEALDLPGPHIRDYLEHLYQMRDWKEMGRLVQVLEIAVSRLFATPLRLPQLTLDED